MSKIQDIKNALEKTNGNLKQAADLIGIKYQTLYWNVKKHNIEFNNIKEKIDSLRVKNLYEKYQSLSLVAKELGCTKEGVRVVMQREGITINDPVRYSFNESFFSKDTEKALYWAGFIAADGCLKKQNNSDVLSIALAAKDRSHLEKLKIDIESNHVINSSIIKNSKRNCNWNDTEKVELKFVSKYLTDDLARFNITQRKTHIYKFPEFMINHPGVHHFMRGYFDGDGSWYIGSSKVTPQVFFSLRGTVDFLKDYRSILEQNGLPKRFKDPRVNNGIGILEYGGNGHSVKIRDYLYKDATIYLERKYNIVKDIVTI